MSSAGRNPPGQALNLNRHERSEKTGPSFENLPGLRAAFRVAEEVGEGVG
jgi:hypothetical protein